MTKQAAAGVPVVKGETYQVDINGLGHSGEGVGKFEGLTVFIPFALPGERVQAVITGIKRNYAVGSIRDIVISSPNRDNPRCPIFFTCGGCQLQHLTYEAQLKVKQQMVIDAVTRIGKLDGIKVNPVLASPDPWYYRNKVQFPVGLVDGRVTVGCFAAGTHDIVDTVNCQIQHEGNNIVIREVRRLIEQLKISTYNEHTGQGVVRHILGRVGAATGEVMVVIVTAESRLPRKNELIDGLVAAVPGLVSIMQNINRKRTNVILGEENRLLWGRETITDRLDNLKFIISADSFFQVNPAQTENLYRRAVQYAGLTKQDTVADVYCGTGTITLFLAREAAQAVGIEINPQAIRDARRNARLNGIENVKFIAGDAERIMPELYARGLRPKVIVVDPPRSGCERSVLETIFHLQPQRVVYISCNPATLARDLAVLQEFGYITREIQPVDMFPQTAHVESIASIEAK